MGKMTYEELEGLADRMSKRIKILEGKLIAAEEGIVAVKFGAEMDCFGHIDTAIEKYKKDNKVDKALDCYSMQEVSRLNARIRVLEKMLEDEREASAQVMRNEESAVADLYELRNNVEKAMSECTALSKELCKQKDKNQADLDAAILAERERCAAVVATMYEEFAKGCTPHRYNQYQDGYTDALDLAEQKIKEG